MLSVLCTSTLALVLSSAPPVVMEPVDDGVVLVQRRAASSDENPWESFLWAPMAVPFPFSALLDGWVPWGRYAWVKNLTGVSFIGCGACLISLFPASFAFAVLSIVLAALGMALAAYMFVASAMRGDALGMCRSTSSGTQSCFNLYNGVMCLSFVVCWPWLGFKLAQRGVYALQADLDPPADPAPAPKPRVRPRPRRPAQGGDGQGGDAWQQPDVNDPADDAGDEGVVPQSHVRQAY